MSELLLDAAGVSAFIARVWPQAAARYGPDSLIHLDAASNSPFVPCHGPQCSQQQSHSKLPVPTTVRPPAPDDWAVGAIQVMAESPEGSLLPPIQIAGSPFNFSRLIFHPPRV